MSNETRRASLAPVLVALISITSVSLFGFTVAYWPEEAPRAVAPANEPELGKWM